MHCFDTADVERALHYRPRAQSAPPAIYGHDDEESLAEFAAGGNNRIHRRSSNVNGSTRARRRRERVRAELAEAEAAAADGVH